MWMVGYNEGGEFNNVVDHSLSGKKLKPLMHRPMTSLNNAPTTTTPSLTHVHANDFLSQYHYHHHLVAQQSKREQFNGAALPVVVSTRWNPTPEQLRALEELYRRGTRTPSAEQIQHITSQLRRFGNIEGKNVFYWFQNHKARERQKRRRQMDQSDISETPEKKDLAASRTVFGVERTKNWTHSTNCSTIAEESVSTQRTAKAVAAESRTERWLLFDEGELQERRNLWEERNSTWHVMQLPCPSPAHVTYHLINTPPNASAPTSIATTTITTTTIMDPSLIKTHDLSLFISPPRENSVINLSSSSSTSEVDNYVVESQTLQLFPLRSGSDGSCHNIEEKVREISASAMNANNFTPCQFFEFLPMKD